MVVVAVLEVFKIQSIWLQLCPERVHCMHLTLSSFVHINFDGQLPQ